MVSACRAAARAHVHTRWRDEWLAELVGLGNASGLVESTGDCFRTHQCGFSYIMRQYMSKVFSSYASPLFWGCTLLKALVDRRKRSRRVYDLNACICITQSRDGKSVVLV